MSDFKVKMRQIQFWLGLCPRSRWGAYSTPPEPLAGFQGPTSKGRGGKRREWREGRCPLYFFLRIYAHDRVGRSYAVMANARLKNRSLTVV